jgi:hypothetical protein
MLVGSTSKELVQNDDKMVTVFENSPRNFYISAVLNEISSDSERRENSYGFLRS